MFESSRSANARRHTKPRELCREVFQCYWLVGQMSRHGTARASNHRLLLLQIESRRRLARAQETLPNATTNQIRSSSDSKVSKGAKQKILWCRSSRPVRELHNIAGPICDRRRVAVTDQSWRFVP